MREPIELGREPIPLSIVKEVASELVHVNVDDEPEGMLAGKAVRDACGGVGGTTLPLTVIKG